LAELLPPAGSPVAALTVAVSVIEPPVLGAVHVIVIEGAAPTAADARVHVTTWPATPHAQPVPVAETKVVPAGSVSVTVTVAAALGPAFETSTVYVSVAPAVTGSGASVIAIDRSALAVTVVDWLAELLPAAGSAVVAVTVALAVIDPPAVGAVQVVAIAGAAPTAGA